MTTRPFGYCIFTFEGGDWSTDDFEGLERGFALAARLGYSYVEGTSYVKPGLLGADDPRTDLQFLNRMGAIAELSGRHGMPLSSIFAAADLWNESERMTEFRHLEVLARIASTLGIGYLPVTIGMRRGSDGQRWSRALGPIVSEAGRRTSEVGVKLLVHPHIETPLETRADIDSFFENADTSVIGMCMDTGHILAGRMDPVAFARDYSSVIDYVHAKDVDKAAADAALSAGDSRARYLAFRDAGEGDVDFPGVFRTLSASGFDGPVLAENDLSPDPEAAMRRAHGYLAGALER
jgi:sugar phosphate isomerase/epimerase